MENPPEIIQDAGKPGLENPLSPEIASSGPENGPGAATDGLAANLAAQHGAGSEPPGGGESTPGGKRRGRPPIHGLYSKAAGSDGKRPVPAPGESEVPEAEVSPDTRLSVVIPADLLGKVVQESLSLGESFAQGKIESAAILAGLTKAEIEPQLKQAQIGDRRKALVGELAPLVIQEWGMDPQMSPSAAVGLILGPWLLSSMTAYSTLARLAQERRGKATPTPGTKP